MAVITQQPLRYAAAFNPVLLSADRQSSDGDALRLIVAISGTPTTLTRDWLNGSVRYNLSSLFKYVFIDKEFIVPGIPDLREDRRLMCRVVISNADTYTQYYYSSVINAVSQRRGQYGLSAYVGKFLTGFDELRRYPGYPLDVALIGVDGGTTFFQDGRPLNLNNPLSVDHVVWKVPANIDSITITGPNVRRDITNNASQVITNNKNLPIYVYDVTQMNAGTIWVEDRCLPSSPFYVRWVNRIGGFEYWMFQQRQVFEHSLDSVETYYAETWDYTDGPPESAHVISGEATDTVTIGAEGLSKKEFDIVSLMIYSPRIEVYNVETAEWSRAYFPKAKSSIDTGETRYAVEFELTINQVKLQF